MKPHTRSAWSSFVSWACCLLLFCTVAARAQSSQTDQLLGAILDRLNALTVPIPPQATIQSVPYLFPTSSTLGEWLLGYFGSSPYPSSGSTFWDQLSDVVPSSDVSALVPYLANISSNSVYGTHSAPYYLAALWETIGLNSQNDFAIRVTGPELSQLVVDSGVISESAYDIRQDLGNLLSIMNDVHDGGEHAINVTAPNLDSLLGASISESQQIESTLSYGFEDIQYSVTDFRDSLWSTNPPAGVSPVDSPEVPDYADDEEQAAQNAQRQLTQDANDAEDYVEDENNWLPQWDWDRWLPGSIRPVEATQPRENISGMDTDETPIYITDSEISSGVVDSARIPQIVLRPDTPVWQKIKSRMSQFYPIMQGVYMLGAAVGIFLMVRREWDYYVSLGHPSYQEFDGTLGVNADDGIEVAIPVERVL